MLSIEIVNVTDCQREENNSYVYKVWVNDLLLKVGTVEGHDRREGWPKLLQMIVDEGITMTDRLLTCVETASFLNVKPSTIRAWTCARRIPFVRVGRRAVRFREADLRAMLKPIPVLRAADEDGGPQTDSIGSAKPGVVKYQPPGL